MNLDTQNAAKQILEIIPLVMKTLASELRRAGDLPNPTHFSIMVVLAHQSFNLSDLAEHQGVSLPTMSSTISTLEDHGWVKRIRASHDRRIVMVELTPEGRQELKKIQHKAEARLAPRVNSLSEADCAALVSGLIVLKKMFDVADFYESGDSLLLHSE